MEYLRVGGSRVAIVAMEEQGRHRHRVNGLLHRIFLLHDHQWVLNKIFKQRERFAERVNRTPPETLTVWLPF